MIKLSVTSVLIVLVLIIGSCSQKVQSEQKGLSALKVSENQRFLMDEKGNPFFWLVKDAELISNADKSEKWRYR